RVLRSTPDHDPLEVIALYRKSAAHSFEALAQVRRNDLGRPAQLLEALSIAQPGLWVMQGPGSDFERKLYGCFVIDAEAIREGRVNDPLLLAEILRDIGDWCIGL